MALLASVQTSQDAASITWSYLLGMLTVAAVIAGGLLLMLYLESDTHRARAARARRLRRKP